MILWYAGMSWWLVWRVFRSPAIDYRLVMLGAVLPSIDVVVRRPTALHVLAGAVVVFGAVVVVTRSRRLASRRWVGIPIGMFFHLVLDGSWADADLFWWPFSGAALGSLSVPETAWPLWLVIAAETVGAAALGGLWLRLGLTDAGRRRTFLTQGHIDRELA